ncbi:hypothetical protein VPJ08_20050, partial [Acinetobacter baumannii]|uniref:hypothetical protein n=1 Tax=Acinetobacter baumannii TaxID=470 RepID=UPI002FE22D4D
TVWIKHTATGSGSCGIAGVADSTGTSQYAIWATASGGVDTISMLANGTAPADRDSHAGGHGNGMR